MHLPIIEPGGGAGRHPLDPAVGAATAYENADNQTGPNRKVAMGVVHLIELAQLRMDQVLVGPAVNACN